MKNFTKQNFKTNPLWIRLLIMAFMLLGVLVPQSAMAVGHTQNLNIGYNDGSDHWTRTIDDNGTIELGELESAPKLIGINAYTTKYNGGNICSGSVSVENATYDATSINWKYNDSDNDQEFWFSINRTLSSTVGDHSVTVTVTIKGGTTNSSCSNSYQRTFKITYTIKETEKEYSLGGYLNGGDKAYNDTFKLIKQNDGTYKGTFNNFNDGTHYFQVFDKSNTKWGVNSYTTLTVGKSTTLSKINNNEKVGISLTKGTPYVFTFNPSNGSFSVELSCTTPTFTISGPDQICEGTNGHEYTIATPAVASGVTYAWSNDLVGVTSESTTDNTYTFNTSANGAKTGTITVTATNGTCTHTETKSISQIAKPTAGKLSITSANLKIDDTETITVTGANGSTKSWSSSDPNVATVDDNGIVTAIAAGTATITYTVQPSLNGCGSAATATATINVCAPPDAFTISIDKTAICSDGNATISIIPDNHTAESYKWCTKNGDTYGNETTIDNKSFTVSTAGTYVVRAYNSTCMTESTNAVELTVDNTITNMFIGLVNPNGGYYDANPLPLCDDQVTLKAWATGAKTYKVYKTSDLNNPVQTGTVNGDGETNAISYTISKSNLSEGEHGYLVMFENTCGTTTTDTKTVTVPPTPADPTLPTEGQIFDRKNCEDHLQYVNEDAGGNMSYMAVLYEGENVTPTQPTDGTTYDINTNNKIGQGDVKVLQPARGITIEDLDPTKIYTLAIYRYHTTCYEYSEPLIVTIDKDIPILGELTINGNEFSVPVTKIGANGSGVALPVMKFQYYNEAGSNWADFGYTVPLSYSKANTVAGGNITATVTPGTLTQGQAYKVRACVANNHCGNYEGYNTNDDITYTVPCSTVLKPQLTHNESSVCKSDTEKVNLNTLAGVNNVNWYKGNNKVADPTQVAITTEGTTTYVVKAVNGLCESEGVEFTLTVNPLPTITEISGNNSAVLNQEVLLTATGNDIASVAWSVDKGTITADPADSKKAILAHSSAESVTVTATATSANGCTASTTKSVTFSAAEDCDPITDNTKIEIWCQVTGTTTPYCHAFNIKDSGNEEFKNWPGLTHTSKNGDYYIWTLDNTNGLDISNNKVGIVFSKNSSGNNQTADITTFYVGNRYYFTYNADGTDKNKNYTKGNSEPLTTYPPLSAPAVNTVSVTSQVGSGVVNFTGQVVKTGCAENANIWVGYQYKLATDEWPTTGVTAANQAGANPLVLNPLGHPNGLDPFTADIPLTDGTYDFRAYVINGYDRGNSSNYDQGVYYGLTKRVTVSLQQQAIKTVTINHAAIDGKTITNPTYCAGTTAYIKLTHDGTPYKGDVVWTSTANHDFSKVEGKENLFSYTVKGEDNVTASVKNDENKDYVSSEPLKIKVYPVPNMPNFTIDKTAICSNDAVGAVITITNPQVGITYQVYKKVGDTETAHGDAVTYNNGTLTINSIKTAGTYFVKAWNEQCKDKVERSLTEAAVTIVDAEDNSIDITPTSKEVNPWMPTTFIVNKTGSYNYTLTCTQTNAQVGSATVSSGNVNIEYNYSFVPTNNGVQVTFTWTNMNNITGAVAPILQDRTGTTPPNEVRGTGNSVTKLIAPNAQGNVIVAAKFEFAGGSQTTADYTYTNQGDAPTSDAIITKKGDTYIIKFPKPADALIDGDGQVTFNPIQYNVTAKLNVDVQGCGTTVATSNVTLTPLTEVCP